MYAIALAALGGFIAGAGTVMASSSKQVLEFAEQFQKAGEVVVFIEELASSGGFLEVVAGAAFAGIIVGAIFKGYARPPRVNDRIDDDHE